MGHLGRYELLRLIIEGKIEGKQGGGQRSWLKNPRECFGKSAGEFFRTAMDKIANTIADVRRADRAHQEEINE